MGGSLLTASPSESLSLSGSMVGFYRVFPLTGLLLCPLDWCLAKHHAWRTRKSTLLVSTADESLMYAEFTLEPNSQEGHVVRFVLEVSRSLGPAPVEGLEGCGPPS